MVGFALPPELDQLYRNSRLVEELEFELVDTSEDPPRVWDIAAFEPLIPVVAGECRASSGAPGAPIATDFDKGVYYVDANGAVQLHSPQGTTLVARSIASLASFEIRAVKSDA